eukprot:COSAG02_NODE_38244_length_431_cov_1.006024_1_plen_110_part_01
MLTVEVATAQAEERAKTLALAQQNEADLMLQIKLKASTDEGRHRASNKRDRLARNARARASGSSKLGQTGSTAFSGRRSMAGSRQSNYAPHPPRGGGGGGGGFFQAEDGI